MIEAAILLQIQPSLPQLGYAILYFKVSGKKSEKTTICFEEFRNE